MLDRLQLAKERAAYMARRAPDDLRVYTEDKHTLPPKRAVGDAAPPFRRGATLGYDSLACDLIADMMAVLEKKPPRAKRPKPDKETPWVRAWRDWYRHRVRDLAFILDRSRSAVWVEAAGLDYDDLLADISARGLLYDPWPLVPRNLDGGAIIAKDGSA